MNWLPWVLSYWPILAIAILILIVCEIFRRYVGPKAALAVLGSGVLYIIFIIGKKIGCDSYQKIADDIKDKREEAYVEIDNRNTTGADVADRLRKGDF